MNFHQSAIHHNIRRLNREQAFDRAFYTVICRASDGDVYAAERVLKNPHSELDILAEDIATGQIENVQTVFAFNPVEGWATNESESVARKILDVYGAPECCREFLEDHLGCAALAQVPS